MGGGRGMSIVEDIAADCRELEDAMLRLADNPDDQDAYDEAVDCHRSLGIMLDKMAAEIKE
jgi:hypothetical protein